MADAGMGSTTDELPESDIFPFVSVPRSRPVGSLDSTAAASTGAHFIPKLSDSQIDFAFAC